MKRPISCCALFCVASAIVPIAAQQPDRPSAHDSPASLAIELRRVKKILAENGDIQALAAVPPAWQVETPERSFSISSEPLRKVLTPQAPTSERTLNNQKGAVWLDHLAEYLEGYARTPGGSRPQARTALTRILARPEFAGTAPPTRWQLFLKRVTNWIRDLLDAILSFAALHPSGSTILFWVVVTGAVAVIGAWLLRLWARTTQTLALTAPELAQKTRTWEEWIRASRAAADRGDPREAIRLAYWAGIARLQEIRALPANTSQTPRECLRFLSSPPPGWTLAPSAFLESLSGLTSGLERFWYARRLASPDDFRESLRHLEALGCRVD